MSMSKGLWVGGAIALIAGSSALLWTGQSLHGTALTRSTPWNALDAMAMADTLNEGIIAQNPPEGGPPPAGNPGGSNRRGPNQQGPDQRGARWLQDLDLSEEQVQQMQAIRTQYGDQMREQYDQLRTARDQMHDLLGASDTSADRLRQQHALLQASNEKLGDLRFESMLEMRAVLTPEQRESLADRMDNRDENRRGPGGEGHREGRGREGRGDRGGAPDGERGPRGFW